MQIRKASKKDLDGIVMLAHELHMHQINDCKVDFKLRKNFKAIHKRFLSEKMKKGKNAIFVAEADKELIGYISGHLDEDPPIFADRRKGTVAAFYIKNGFRGRGIGKELFARLKEWFEKKKIPSLRITVAKCNPGAKRLYESLGFKPAQFEYLVMKMQD